MTPHLDALLVGALTHRAAVSAIVVGVALLGAGGRAWLAWADRRRAS